LDGLRLEYVDIFYGHLEYCTELWDILWPFGTFWYNVHTMKNLANLCPCQSNHRPDFKLCLHETRILCSTYVQICVVCAIQIEAFQFVSYDWILCRTTEFCVVWCKIRVSCKKTFKWKVCKLHVWADLIFKIFTKIIALTLERLSFPNVLLKGCERWQDTNYIS
jgi:hypothetical protein